MSVLRRKSTHVPRRSYPPLLPPPSPRLLTSHLRRCDRCHSYVMRARSLLIVDTDGEQDPFLKASLVVGEPPQAVTSAGVHKTEVAEDSGRRAVWNEVFDMTIPADVVAQQPRLVLEVFDQDKRLGGMFGTVDNPIGSTEVPLAQLLAPPPAGDASAEGRGRRKRRRRRRGQGLLRRATNATCSYLET